MQKGQALVWIIIGTLIIVAVGGAYYLGRSTTPKPSPAPVVTSPAATQRGEQTSQPSPIKDASPAPTGSGETANWKTYTSTTFGYSISFPDTYEVPPQTDRQKSQLGVDRNMCVTLRSNGTCYIVINASDNNEGLPLQDWINKYTTLDYHSTPGIPTKLNDYSALLVETTTGVSYFLGNNLNVYQIDIGNNPTVELNKILSTFKFEK